MSITPALYNGVWFSGSIAKMQYMLYMHARTENKLSTKYTVNVLISVCNY